MNLIQKLTEWFVFKPSKASIEAQELADIKEQMVFWHREEDQTLQAAIDAIARKDWEQYEIYRQQHQAARLRCKTEVTDKLKNLNSTK